MSTAHDITLSLFSFGRGGSKGWIPGNGKPTNAVGETGDFYLDANQGYVYGPKQASGWPDTHSFDVNAALKSSFRDLLSRLGNLEGNQSGQGTDIQTITDRVTFIEQTNDGNTTLIGSISDTLEKTKDSLRRLQVQVNTAFTESGGNEFSAAIAWQFIGSTAGFSASNALMTNSSVTGPDKGCLNILSNGSDSYIDSPGFSLPSGKFTRTVRALIRVEDVDHYRGLLRWTTDTRTVNDPSIQKQGSVPEKANTWQLVEWDLTEENDWLSNPIQRIRLYLPASLNQKVSVQWIAIGDKSFAASAAYATTERYTRATKDEAFAQEIQRIAAQVGASGADWSQEISALATKTEAHAKLVQTLQARFEDNFAQYRRELDSYASLDRARAREITELTASVGSNIANLRTELHVEATKTNAIAQRVTETLARVSNAESEIRRVESSQASFGAAEAQTLQYLKAQVGDSENSGIRASVKELRRVTANFTQSTAEIRDELEAKFQENRALITKESRARASAEETTAVIHEGFRKTFKDINTAQTSYVRQLDTLNSNVQSSNQLITALNSQFSDHKTTTTNRFQSLHTQISDTEGSVQNIVSTMSSTFEGTNGAFPTSAQITTKMGTTATEAVNSAVNNTTYTIGGARPTTLHHMIQLIGQSDAAIDGKVNSANTRLTNLTNTVTNHQNSLTTLTNRITTAESTASEFRNWKSSSTSGYKIIIDSAGTLKGFGLVKNDGTNANHVDRTAFIVEADQFQIKRPGASTRKIPFLYDAATNSLAINSDVKFTGNLAGANINGGNPGWYMDGGGNLYVNSLRMRSGNFPGGLSSNNYNLAETSGSSATVFLSGLKPGPAKTVMVFINVSLKVPESVTQAKIGLRITIFGHTFYLDTALPGVVSMCIATNAVSSVPGSATVQVVHGGGALVSTMTVWASVVTVEF